jgi:hypothetical protein
MAVVAQLGLQAVLFVSLHHEAGGSQRKIPVLRAPAALVGATPGDFQPRPFSFDRGRETVGN